MVLLKSTLCVTSELYVDNCLTGMGAFYQGKVYAIPIHPFLSSMSIIHQIVLDLCG